MISKILITNNTDANHSADTWAMAGAEMLADLSGLTGSRAIDAQRLQLKFADLLEKHFDEVQLAENLKLNADPKHVATDIAAHLEADLVLIAQEIEAAAVGTQWEYHYQLPEVHTAVMNELRSLFHSSMHVDRLYHCDRNPKCEHAKAYRDAYHGVK